MSRARIFGTETFGWDDLLRAPMTAVDVYILYFPTRFELPVDAAVTDALKTFGKNTSSRTSVDFWDPSDENFSEALALFGLGQPPALVLATGLRGGDTTTSPRDGLFCISFDSEPTLADRATLAIAVNAAHEILIRGDRREIAQYLRNRKIKAMLGAMGRAGNAVVEQLLRLRPKVGLPGGTSVEIG